VYDVADVEEDFQDLVYVADVIAVHHVAVVIINVEIKL